VVSLEILISALLPIVVTLGLGFFAGWRHDFSAAQSAVLNRMVMLYALPMSLAAGILSIDKTHLLQNRGMFLWLASGMIGGYLFFFLIFHYLFRKKLGLAALRALAVAGPAVPFVGTSVLSVLFGNESSVSITICSLLMNLFQVPLTLVFLSVATKQASGEVMERTDFFRHLFSAFQEPVVWAPILSFLLVMCDFQLPHTFKSSFTLLGSATGGVALFASGAILYAQKVQFSKGVFANVASKNLLLPALLWLAMALSGTSHALISITVITMAIPSASIAVILAVRFGLYEKETASTLFFSTVLSPLTMGLFILFLK
jgi:predicted permease